MANDCARFSFAWGKKAAWIFVILALVTTVLPGCNTAFPDITATAAATAQATPDNSPVGTAELSGSWFFEIILSTVSDKGKGIFGSTGKPKNTDFVVAINPDGTGTVTMDRIAYPATYQDGKLTLQGPAFSGKTPYKNICFSMEGAVIRSYMKLTLKGSIRFYDQATNDEYATGTWDADKLEE